MPVTRANRRLLRPDGSRRARREKRGKDRDDIVSLRVNGTRPVARDESAPYRRPLGTENLRRWNVRRMILALGVTIHQHAGIASRATGASVRK